MMLKSSPVLICHLYILFRIYQWCCCRKNMVFRFRGPWVWIPSVSLNSCAMLDKTTSLHLSSLTFKTENKNIILSTSCGRCELSIWKLVVFKAWGLCRQHVHDIDHYYLSMVVETCLTDVDPTLPYLSRQLLWVYHALFSVIVCFLEEEGHCPICLFPNSGSLFFSPV